MAARKKASKKTAKKTARRVAKPSPRAKIVAALQKKFGVEAAGTIAQKKQSNGEIKEFISTGVDVIDNYLLEFNDQKHGGLPVGRWSEWFGPEGCGKTALAHSALAANQRAGGVSVLVDAEHSFDSHRARVFGIDESELIIIEPSTLDECCDEIKETLHAHDASVPMLIVWDSLAALVPEREMEVSASKRTVGGVSAMLSTEFKKINAVMPDKRAHILMINQVRANIGVMFGPNVTTPGGNAPKFFASQRCQFFGGKGVKDKDGKHIAKVVTLLMIKTRLSEPFRKARVRFDYATGYNNEYSTIEHAKTLKVIDPREGGYKGRGKEGRDHYIDALDELAWKPSIPLSDMKLIEEQTDSETEDSDDDE